MQNWQLPVTPLKVSVTPILIVGGQFDLTNRKTTEGVMRETQKGHHNI
jgi:hypothetical protein